MKTKTVEDTATIGTAFDSAKQDIEMLSEEMRSWADNMDGTGLENTSKYEMVDDCASQLEEINSNLEDVTLSDEIKSKSITFKYIMPYGKYIGRSWRLGQAESALRAVAEALPEGTDYKDEIEAQCNEMDSIDFPGMY